MLLFQKISRPMLVSCLLLGACSKAPDKPSYRGLPDEPIPKSFKIQVQGAGSGKGLDPSDLATKLKTPVAKLGCSLASVVPIAWDAKALTEELAETYHVTLKDCALDKTASDRALVAFSEESYVAAVESEAKVRLRFAENDPRKSEETHLPQISRDEVCELVPADAPEIVVAIIDSGVERDHPDLAEAFARDASGEVIGANFVGKGSRGAPDSAWDDQNGHGTHVAGIVAATGNNAIGVTGIASCAKVRIMPVRVMDADGAGSSLEIDRGIQWAIAQGADIINLSLGSNVGFRSPQASHPSSLFAEAAARGVAVFAAAGNESLTLGKNGDAYVYSYPASYDNVISVAALDAKGQLAEFSNRGETVDIAAPGVNILSTYPGQGYRRESGTSMASPVAAGAYALALAASRQKTKLSSTAVQEALSQAVESKTLNADDVLSGGIMNIKSLVSIIGQPNSREPELTVEQPADQVSDDADETALQEPESLVFPGLSEGMSWEAARRITVSGWPKGKAARIYLYWLTDRDNASRSFVMLDRSNLSDDGLSVSTSSAYRLYGQGRLIAEAVDVEGNSLSTQAITVRGL